MNLHDYFLTLSGTTIKFPICPTFHSLMCLPRNLANIQYSVKYVCPSLDCWGSSYNLF